MPSPNETWEKLRELGVRAYIAPGGKLQFQATLGSLSEEIQREIESHAEEIRRLTDSDENRQLFALLDAAGYDVEVVGYLPSGTWMVRAADRRASGMLTGNEPVFVMGDGQIGEPPSPA